MLANNNIVSGGQRRRQGGQDFSAPESENSTASPVALNNDRSLISQHPLNICLEDFDPEQMKEIAGSRETAKMI